MQGKWIYVIAIVLLSIQPVWAAKYVSDVLWVTLKESADDNASSIRVMKSGTKLEIIDENEVNDYIHVKTSNGEEGWVKARYLMDEPIAGIRVAQLEKELEKLKEENSSMRESMSSIKKDGKETDKERKRMLSENQQLVKENERLKELAAEPQRLAEENAKLKAENTRLQTEYNRIKQNTTSASDENQRNWFMTGAGVLFTGIILGLIFPSLRFRRRSTWS